MTLGALWLALSAPLGTGCGTGGHGPEDPAFGSLKAALTLPDGSEIEEIQYAITGNGMTPRTGTVPVGNSTRVEFQVGNIPAGQAYTITLTATTSDDQSCSGSNDFEIVAGQTTTTSVVVQCGVGEENGGVKVDGEVTQCPIATGLSATPTEVLLGGSVALSAATSPATAPLEWSATAGEIANATAADTTYTCSQPGDHTITLTVDGGASCSASTQQVVVTCTDQGGGTGGTSGSGGTGGGGTGGGQPIEVVLQHVDRGAFNSAEIVDLLGQPWKVIGTGYQVRSIGDGAAPLPATRNYFTFDLASVEGTIVGATLRVRHSGTSYDSPDASETVALFDVSTAPAVLQAPDENQGSSLLASIFSDLGAGTSFGSFIADVTDNGTTEAVTLNGAAMTSLNAAAAAGTLWSIGGSVTSANVADFGVTERVFRGTDGTGGTPQPPTELALTVE